MPIFRNSPLRHLPPTVMRNGNVVCGTTSPSHLWIDLWKLRHRASTGGEAVLRTTSQSRLRLASSPGRGATGESVMAVLNEQSFLQSGTTGLRCFDSRLLAQRPLVERGSAAATNEDKARRFALDWACANSRACPACQGLPYQGSWRAQARLRGCTKRL